MYEPSIYVIFLICVLMNVYPIHGTTVVDWLLAVQPPQTRAWEEQTRAANQCQTPWCLTWRPTCVCRCFLKLANTNRGAIKVRDQQPGGSHVKRRALWCRSLQSSSRILPRRISLRQRATQPHWVRATDWYPGRVTQVCHRFPRPAL